jgi:hypothetical protein
MKYIKLFEGFYSKERERIKDQYESQIEELRKEFNDEAKEILSHFEDEFNYECLIDDFEENDVFFTTLEMKDFKPQDIDSIFKNLEDIYQIVIDKGMNIWFEFLYYRRDSDTRLTSQKNQTIEDFKKESLEKMKKCDKFGFEKKLTIFISS